MREPLGVRARHRATIHSGCDMKPTTKPQRCSGPVLATITIAAREKMATRVWSLAS